MNKLMRPILFVLLCVVVVVGDDLEQAYARLQSLRGREYKKARAAFLRRREARGFLASRLASKVTWQALALQTRLTYVEEVRDTDIAFEGAIADMERAHSLSDCFTALDKICLYFVGLYPGWAQFKVEAMPDAIKRYISLQLEFVVHNPEELSEEGRLWTSLALFQFLPVTREQAQYYVEVDTPQRYWGKVKLDFELIRSWLAELQESSDPIIALGAAQRLMDERSLKILQELSRRNDEIGVLAGLFYAGRVPGTLVKDFHYDAVWLENWIKGLDRKRVLLLARMFTTASRNKKGLFKVQYLSSFLSVPNEIAGLVLRHHHDPALKALERVYQAWVKDAYEEFISLAETLEDKEFQNKEDQEDFIQREHGTWTTYPCWPRSILPRLRRIRRTRNSVYNWMLDQVIAFLESDKDPWPTGEELNRAWFAKLPELKWPPEK